jgi:flagellar assembly factor FliW
MILSTRFGQLDVDPSTTIAFPHGIPGFETSVEWKLLHEESESANPDSGTVHYLQSLNDPDVALPVTDPSVFGFSYEFVLSDSELAELKLDDPSDLAVLVVLSSKNPVSQNRPASVQDIFANISAPILINTKSRIGMQKIFTGSEAKVGINAPA